MDSRKDKPGEHDKDGFFQNHKRGCSHECHHAPRSSLLAVKPFRQPFERMLAEIETSTCLIQSRPGRFSFLGKLFFPKRLSPNT